MSLDSLRTACLKAFQDRAELATNRALNLRPRMGTMNVPSMTADEYAMFQVEALAEARVWLEAQKAVENEFKKLTQPEEKPVAQEHKPKQRMYG